MLAEKKQAVHSCGVARTPNVKCVGDEPIYALVDDPRPYPLQFWLPPRCLHAQVEQWAEHAWGRKRPPRALTHVDLIFAQ